MSKLSIIDHQTIRRHPANNSPSKIAHHFSKSKRFPDINPQCPNAFYAYDSHLSKRKTGFGYGQKFDFTKPLTSSPPSTKYEHKSFCDDSKKRGLSFGLSRQSSPDKSYLIPQIHKNPGPGKYQNQKVISNNISYSIRPKTIDVFEKHNTSKHTPSPHTYNFTALQPKNGRFFYSKFSDTKLGALNMKSQRFQKIKQTPGPHSYIQGDSLSGNAKYILSHRKGNGNRVFNKTARTHGEKWVSTLNPGPGHYQKPSDFGIYGDTKYYKTLSNFSTIH